MDNGAAGYRRFLDGDDRGIAEVVGEYKDGLILYLNCYTGNIHAAEELAEDTFFRLITKKPVFAGRSSFKSWLYAIGRHVALDWLRRRARLAPAEDMEALRGDEESLEAAFIGEESRIAVHRAMSALAPDYRRVLWLVYFEDFSNREAAVALKKNERQIRNLLYRAKQALRAELDREGFDHEKL